MLVRFLHNLVTNVRKSPRTFCMDTRELYQFQIELTVVMNIFSLTAVPINQYRQQLSYSHNPHPSPTEI